MKKNTFNLLKSRWSRLALIILAGVLFSGQAYANSISFSFYKLTNNNVENISDQLYGTVWDATQANAEYGLSLTGTDVLFTFINNVGIASNVAEIYFDNGSLLGLSTVYNSLSGSTQFTGGSASPGNLPGGNDAVPPFVATAGFVADITNTSDGLNAAVDEVGMAFTLLGGQDWDDVVAELGDGRVRVGFHIRSIGLAGGSDGYINGPPSDDICVPGDPGCEIPGPVPEPATMLLLGTGLVGVAGVARRRMKKQA